jgi:hypothetical protein
MVRPFRTLLAIVFLAGIALLLPVAAFADPPVLPPLHPPPPGNYTCQPTGAGPICRKISVDHLQNWAPGLVCGTAAHPVELLVDGTDNFRFTRYYNTAGYMTQRFVHEDFQATIRNPETGLSARNTQVSEFIDTLAVPGDETTTTFQQTGVVKFFLPGSGVLMRDVGREVVGPDGNDVFSAGQHQISIYFGTGDHSVLGPLCAALGSPGTP